MPRPKRTSNQVTEVSAKPADVGHHRRDVGDGREDTSEAEHGHRHGQQDLDVLEGGELVAEMHALGLRHLGDQLGDSEQTDHSERGDSGEGDPPARGLPDQRAQGDTDHIGDGETAEHHGDRTGLLLRRDKLGGDDGSDAEERAMGERGDDSARQHQPEGRGDGGEQVADDEQPHQQHQHPLAGHLRAERGHDRGADHHAEGIAGHQQSGRGDGDTEVTGDLRQHTHDHELCGSDSEGPDREGQERERHGGDTFPNDCRSALRAFTIVAHAG